jgi:hypothetical protein
MYYCDIKIQASANTDQIFTPILHRHTIFSKKRLIRVQSDYQNRFCNLRVQNMAIPVLLPQSASMISFDATGDTIKTDFHEHLRQAASSIGFKIFTGKLRNFDTDINRAVSMGEYSGHDISPDHLTIFQNTIDLDMMLTPSLIHFEQGKNFLHSPLRWLIIPGEHRADPGFHFYFNSAVLYISKQDLEKMTPVTLNEELDYKVSENSDLFKFPCKWIGFRLTGNVFTKDITVCISRDLGIKDEFIAESGDEGCYYRATILTYTRYQDGKTVNIIDQVVPFTMAPYEILPYFFTYYNKENSLSTPLLQYSVPVNVIENSLRRMHQFQSQNLDIAGSVEDFLKQKNPLYRYSESEDGDFFNIAIVHPVLIYRLIHLSINNSEQTDKKNLKFRHSIEILRNYEKIADYLISQEIPISLKIVLPGMGNFMQAWETNFSAYLKKAENERRMN